MRPTLCAFLFAALTGACSPDLDHNAAPTIFTYTETGISGLREIRPYPTSDDVCQEIHTPKELKSEVAAPSFLIACPKHEKGAIEDRQSIDGAKVIAHAKHWTILKID
ncbi:MAG: hypothetical protein MJH10_16155 [Epibacterium sp.]|nr:hypothetical protein [Epibacterium sp.]NQX75048.1 hypothetical protein [Epibacterium sp.]